MTLVACLVSACAHQVYEPKPIDAATTADKFHSRSLNNPELLRYLESQGVSIVASPEKWGVHALTLAAFHYHPKLAVARAQWQAARAQEITAGQRQNPNISSQIEHHSQTDGGISPWALALAIDIPIETAGKRQIRIDQATHLSQAARLAIGQQAWEVFSNVRSAHIDYRVELNKQALLAREIALQDAVVKMLQKRLEAGFISDMDLATARLRLLRLQNAEAAGRARVAELHAQLAVAIGIPAASLSAVEIDASAPVPPALDTLPSSEVRRTALLNRLDIRESLARHEAAESRLRLEIARQHPDIVLSPGYMFDQNDNIWSLGFSILLNLLNKNEGPIAEAEAQREVEARQFEALQARVIGEQELALAQYESRLAELGKTEAMVRAQQDAMTRSERQFKAGYIDRLEWTTAQLEALAAEQGQLEATIRVEKALAALESALQHPLDESKRLALPDQNSEDSSS